MEDFEKLTPDELLNRIFDEKEKHTNLIESGKIKKALQVEQLIYELEDLYCSKF